VSSTSRGMAPREGLKCLLVKMGHTSPLVEPHRGPQAGKSGDPRSQDANSSSQAQGALRLGFEAKPRGKCGASWGSTACCLDCRVATDKTWASPLPHAALISAWLGGPHDLHSYSLIASDVLPQLFYLAAMTTSSCNLSWAPSSPLPWRLAGQGRRRRSPSPSANHLRPSGQLSDGQWCLTRNPWTRSALRSLPISTNGGRWWPGPHPTPPLIGQSLRSILSLMPYGPDRSPLSPPSSTPCFLITRSICYT